MMAIGAKPVIVLLLCVYHVLGYPSRVSEILVNVGNYSTEDEHLKSMQIDDEQGVRAPEKNTTAFIVTFTVGCVAIAGFLTIFAIWGFQFVRKSELSRSTARYVLDRRHGNQELTKNQTAYTGGTLEKRGKSFYFDEDRGLWSRKGLVDEGSVSSLGMVFYQDIEGGESGGSNSSSKNSMDKTPSLKSNRPSPGLTRGA